MSIDKGYGPLGLPEPILHAPRWYSCCLHFHQDNGDLIYGVYEQWPWFHFSYMESLSISLQSSGSQWATEGWTFFLLYSEAKCLSVKSFICWLLLCVCVSSPLLCICEVVCVSTWMYLNLLLFTPIVQLCLRGLLWSNWMSRGRGKPVAANVVPAGLIICNTAAALPALSHPLMNTEMNVVDVRGERRGETQGQSRFNQLPDRTITLSTSTAQRWISV